MGRREQLESFVAQLGREFVRLEMEQHARKLRLYYLALRHGLTQGAFDVDVHWSEKLVLDWMKVLAMPSFEHAYPRRPRRSPCPKCLGSRNQQSVIHTDM